MTQEELRAIKKGDKLQCSTNLTVQPINERFLHTVTEVRAKEILTEYTDLTKRAGKAVFSRDTGLEVSLTDDPRRIVGVDTN
jgi:hypothetical protein